MKSAWHIELWKGPKVRRLEGGAGETSRFRSRQAAALLAFLAFHRGQLFGRERLIEMLWPGCEPGAGRNRLSVALSSLRTVFEGDPVFQVEGDRIGLDASLVSTDVALFKETLRLAHLEADEMARLGLWQKATQVYGGAFLPDLQEEWIMPASLALEDEFFAALHRAIVGARKANRLDEALALARRGLEIDSAREETHRDLIRVLAAKGQGAAALRAGIEAEKILRERLGAPLSPPTRQMLREIEARLAAPSENGITFAPPPLPTTWNRFFGRERDLDELHRCLQNGEARLITLSGAGGAGKTRLAAELARRLTSIPNTRVLWLEGAALFEPHLLWPALGDALGVAPGNDLKTSALDELNRGPTIVFVDNFEQLVPDGLGWLRELLSGANSTRVVLTSRRVTRLNGEREWPVVPLAVPPDNQPLTSPNQRTWAGVELFCDRARAVRPDFDLSPANQGVVEALCRRLDGLPLALELAAARLGVCSPAQILEQLSRGDALASPCPDIAARQRTLRATIAWSAQLLSPELRAFWARLSVFRGGFSPEAARAVCGEKGAFEALSALRDHSLLVAQTAENGPVRFRFLETTREFAGELLSPSELEAAQEAHALFFLQEARRIEPLLLRENQEDLMATLRLEEDNLRAALAWAIARDPEMALELSARLEDFWERRGLLSEAARFLGAALAAAPAELRLAPGSFWGRAACEMGRVAWQRGELETARFHLEGSIEAFEAQNDQIALAWALCYLGVVEARRGQTDPARTLFERALQMGHDANYRELIAECLAGLVNLALMTGDFALLGEIAPQKLAVQRSLGNRRGVAFALLDLGLFKLFAGESASSRACFEEALSHFRALDDSWGQGQTLAALGTLARQTRQFDTAREQFRAALSFLREIGNSWESGLLLDQFGFLASDLAQHERAVLLLSAAHALREGARQSAPPFVEEERARVLQKLQGVLRSEEFAFSWQRGALLEQNAAFDLAMEAESGK